jgi:adenine-specific DNA-methyltransferase
VKRANQGEQAQLSELVDRTLAEKAEGDDQRAETLEAEIDQIVYRLFDLTPEEIALIENSTAT